MWITALIVAPALAATSGFHAATSGPEQAVAALLRRVDADDQVLDNLLGGRDPSFRRTVDYRAMLTPALLTAIRQSETAKVGAACGGHDRAGELCGFDFVPVTCAQDSVATELVRTEADDGRTARIAYAGSAEATAAIARYALVRGHGRWLIDGVDCGGGVAFHMP